MLSRPSSWDRLSPDQDTAPLGAFDVGPVELAFRVGRYVVLEEIGRGGMGRVVRAYDPKLQREVALKEVRRETLGPTGAQRLVAEARAMAKLSHPNVVAVYDVEEIDHGQVVLVMEYVAGQTLGAWLQSTRPWRDVVAHFRQAGRGLAAAHAAGLLHRDFKPENVLVGADGRGRVTDFGLAREILPEPTSEPEPADDTPPAVAILGLTAPGAIVGTLPYLAPERLTGAPADAASDQFAYCVSLWEALFGERPFVGQSVGELAFAMAAGPPRPPTSSRVPSWLLAAITRGLSPYTGDRWPSMQALLDALSVDPARRRRRWVQATLGLGTLAIVAGGVQAWSSARALRCTESGARDHLAGAWDDERRGEVRAAVLGVGASYATDVWTRTEHTLDHYASAWTRMHVETCEATRVRGEQSRTVMDLRMACLHRAKVDLAAATHVLAAGDAQTVPRAHEVLASLGSLARCADVDALQSDVEPPAPEETDAVEQIREHVARATAARRGGRYDLADSALDAADASLSTVAYEPVRAQVTVARGLLFDTTGEYERAEAALREGLRLASRSRQALEMHDAATALLVVVGAHRGRFDEGMRYADLARGLAEGDLEREARVNVNLADVLHAKGEYAAAEAERRRAIALLETLDPDHPEIATCRSNLADEVHAQGRYAEAEAEFRTVLEMQSRALGAEHPALAATHHRLALTLGEQANARASTK
jgi:tetratricopeptide (TPR) repeat protein